MRAFVLLTIDVRDILTSLFFRIWLRSFHKAVSLWSVCPGRCLSGPSVVYVSGFSGAIVV